MPVIPFLVLCVSICGHWLLGRLLRPIGQIFLRDLLEIHYYYYFPCIYFLFSELTFAKVSCVSVTQ